MKQCFCLIIVKFSISVYEFLVSDWFTAYRLLANDPAFCLIRKLDAMSIAAEFKCFRREAKILSKNMVKSSATITKVENLIKQLHLHFHSQSRKLDTTRSRCASRGAPSWNKSCSILHCNSEVLFWLSKWGCFSE